MSLQTLGGGALQRLAITMALSAPADVYLLDAIRRMNNETNAIILETSRQKSKNETTDVHTHVRTRLLNSISCEFLFSLKYLL